MNTSTALEFHAVVSTAVAAAIVALGGLALDQGHIAAAPRGIVEIGALVPVEATQQIAALPEIVVTGKKA